MEIELNYTDWKSQVDTKKIPYHSFNKGRLKYLVAVDGNLFFIHQLSNNDLQDYEDNYLSGEGAKVLETDMSGRKVTRTAATQKGWKYQAFFIEYEASVGTLYCRDHDNTDLSSQFSVLRYSDETTLTSTAIAVTKEVITWKPTFDYEVISGTINIDQLAASDMRIWVTAGLYNEASNNAPLSIHPFVTGGLNLSLLEYAKTDGRASKFMAYETEGAPFPTNRMQWTLRHPAGLSSPKMLVRIDLYKA